jgi:deazaflavin-dependent oxidoreductase (nitroreductase family)
MRIPKFMIRYFSQMHAAAYRRSNGQRRNQMNGLPVLLLTTTGRHTGKPHTVPVVYIAHGNVYLIAPGVVPRPDWYLNLRQEPQAEIQVGGRTIPIAAEELTGPERARLWASVPQYWKTYEQRAGITLPLMRLRVTKT